MADRQTSNGTCTTCASGLKAQHYAHNPQARQASNAKYYAANSEFVGQLNQAWRVANPDGMKLARRGHYESNKGRYTAATARRKKWVARATPSWAEQEKIAAVYSAANILTKQTGVIHHVDHEIPLRGDAVCGLHVHYNLRPIPALDNLKKGSRYG